MNARRRPAAKRRKAELTRAAQGNACVERKIGRVGNSQRRLDAGHSRIVQSGPRLKGDRPAIGCQCDIVSKPVSIGNQNRHEGFVPEDVGVGRRKRG
jgi:hypothetical protein